MINRAWGMSVETVRCAGFTSAIGRAEIKVVIYVRRSCQKNPAKTHYKEGITSVE